MFPENRFRQLLEQVRYGCSTDKWPHFGAQVTVSMSASAIWRPVGHVRFTKMKLVASSGLLRRSQLLSDQLTIPHPQQQLFQFIEIPGSEFGAPVALDLPQDVEDLCVGSVSSPREADDARSALVG